MTSRALHEHAAQLCQRHLRLADHGPKCTALTLLTLFYAAARLTSLAAAGGSLSAAPADTAVRTALLATLPQTHELQRRVNRALQGALPRCLRRRPQPIAIDRTLTPYHGQPLHHRDEVYRSKAKSGTSHFHAYATAYVICRGRRFTLALAAVRRGPPLEEVIRYLLTPAARTGGRRRYLLLDRGCCSVDVICYLQAARRPFRMPLPLRGRKADHPKGPSGSRVCGCRKRSGWARYTLRNDEGRTATVEGCVKGRNRRGERNRRGREALVDAFGAGLAPGSYAWVQETYRSRFGIETSYRQLQQARIRTSTRDPLLRLLYVGIALILRNVWVWLHWQVIAPRQRGGRRLNPGGLRLRQMLHWIQHWVEAWLGVRDEIGTERSLWQGDES